MHNAGTIPICRIAVRVHSKAGPVVILVRAIAPEALARALGANLPATGGRRGAFRTTPTYLEPCPPRGVAAVRDPLP